MTRPPSHRGPAPQDDQLFDESQLHGLRSAARDLCWLLDRGYASRSALHLVGNRYDLTARQRMAVARCCCSIDDAHHRNSLQVKPEALTGNELWIDGYNVLTVLESALAGAVVLLGRDGCCRDIAGIHRRYRKVKETIPVLQLIGNITAHWGVTRCHWWLDKPVSNSGRLKTLILEIAADSGWNMKVDLSFNPDRVLSDTEQIIATSDGIVLDRCRGWINLARHIITESIPDTHLLNLSPQ